MKEWIKANLWEIGQSTALRNLGALLALTHVLTYMSWSHSSSYLFSIGHKGPSLCWSFLPQCMKLNPFLPGQGHALLVAYLVISILAVLVFFGERWVGLGWFLLILAFGIKSFFQLLDHSLTANIHVVLFFIQTVFLFIPQKRRVIKSLVIVSYLTLGFLKLNEDWMAGFWLTAKIDMLPDKGAEWAAAVSALVELIAPWLLLSRQWQKFASGLGALLLYHITAWVFLDFLEPAVYSCFLLFFAVSFFEQRRLEREHLYQSYIRPEPSRAWVPFGIAVFLAFQFLSVWIVSPTLADNPLHMTKHPIPVKCQQFTFASFEKELRELPSHVADSSSSEETCHPNLRFQTIQAECEEVRKEPGFSHLSSYFLKRSLSQEKFQRIFEIKNICDRNATISTAGISP